MATYEIKPSSHGSGFRVEVLSDNGTRHTMLGFDTEVEANEWVKDDKEQERFEPAPDED
jgi:hypothetical protein